MSFKLKSIIFFVIVLLVAAGVFFLARNKKSVVVVNENSEENFPEDEGISETDKVENKETILENEKPQEEEVKTVPKMVAENNDSQLKIIAKPVDFGFASASNRTIDTVIIHSSYDALGQDPYSVSGIIKEYKEYGVAAHYLIDRKGGIYRLVEEKNIAYHAGTSRTPDGRTNVNAFSIGIELMNTKTDKYTDEQYAALKNLLADIKKRYKIKYVLGHKDIAPGRKDDPWNFNFDKLK